MKPTPGQGKSPSGLAAGIAIGRAGNGRQLCPVGPFHRVAAFSRLRRPSRRRNDEGVTLIEVVVAFTVLLITVLPLTYLLTSALSSAADSRQRTSALQLADSWLEILSNTQPPVSNGIVITNTPTNPATFSNITASNTQIPNSTLAGTTYAVSADYVPQSVNNQGGSDLCSSGQPPSPSHPDVILLQVTVTWNHGNSSVTDTTAVDYPQPGLQTQGFLSV
ncbi:MAG TPA: prepilin-type N-terminal cleavage/methylation domain-containing protein, partial [Acidimicrobiales bacterium]|nr:prepilin-type N-terminal cleavage/methylation domain-containing protein [Acidimicrobiales bacterium]